MALRSLAVYCGSSLGHDRRHRALAADLGRELARRRIQLVYGGGHIGLMGAVADAALRDGGRVVGVITAALAGAEVAHGDLTELITVATMHERKLAMSERADGFVMLPGGFGTLDEFFEALTWAQLGIHTKPCAVLDPTGYYGPLLAWVDGAVAEGFVSRENSDRLVIAKDPTELLDQLSAW